ncbi:aminotransferase class V-fold PLP-dependent enzyme [Rhodobium gokarnense]|uniref:Selenocysteine lyase/cysteine desulfurase n=1 Tax=Rhodobium gokarnense TaxID=364296 RepID=A0ABT3HC84_9HYPH|nr:aminotransferase class V-fold PLP-dependent enzyme [Rhodobium gokarnense]MCW2308019.1 selenocysteine lyase/cysteine desulfurase [Rhodobium gokarnense]
MTTRYDAHFELGDATWLNTAHQGALPTVAAEAARRAIAWKQKPFELTGERFKGVPEGLRAAVARLLNANEDEIVLANSASYGLHLIANAYPWRQGDEIIVMETDFPSDILPWLALEARYGVKVRRLKPQGRVLSPDELRAAVTPATRLFCTTLVHSFSGHAIDLDALGDVCQSAGVVFVVNASQALGARALDVTGHPVDAVTTVGFKWLCGPYGTGFCWMAPRLIDRLHRTHAYWLSMLTADDLAGELGELRVGPVERAADFDVFGTANFFNFTALREAIDLLLAIGLEAVEDHNQRLVQKLVESCTENGYRLISPSAATASRSSLVLLTDDDPAALARLKSRLDREGIFTAVRAGAVRLSPHLYNSTSQIDLVGDILNESRAS